MPIYEFRCTACGELVEQLLPISRMDEPGPCPSCDGALRRVFSRVAVKLNGWGFSSTDAMVADGPTRGSFSDLAARADRISEGG